MRTYPVLLRGALAGALVLGSGVNARSEQGVEESRAWATPMAAAHGQATATLGAIEPVADPAAMEAAGSILDREEAASDRQFDPAFRAAVLAKLASKSLEQLEVIRKQAVGGWEPSTLGQTQADLVYTPVTPCRIIDTRNAGGQIAAGASRNFTVAASSYSAQGGVAGSCGIPFGPTTAAVINFVAVGGTAAGQLNLAPFPNAFPALGSIINWSAGNSAIANGLTVPICNPSVSTCTFDISLRSNNSAIDVVADVQGYFAAPFATSLSVQIVFSPFFVCGGSQDCTQFQNCNAGYTITGGGCQLAVFSPGTWTWSNSSPGGTTNGWVCQGTNLNFSLTQSMRTYAMCSRVPGR